MRMYDIIKKKRDGMELSKEEIFFFINRYVKGEIPDYQASALCMAIFFKGMSAEETFSLTKAICESGEKLDLSGIKGIKADKHSTGGVGDKTTLIVAPTVASLGVTVAKMSGRGLGHTGGTIDKLESITGFNTELSEEEFEKTVNDTGIAVVSQSAELAPADKMLYALRDVTATVDSLPLIASSIMGKKLAADDDCIVLDVKTGSGAFMKNIEESRELAKIMVDIGVRAGKRIAALITDMDKPLGNTIGNSLEVIEAIETLKGNGPEDLTELSVALSANILYLAGNGSYKECEKKVRMSLKDGKALQTFIKMVKAQGGDTELIKDTDKFPKAKYSRNITVEEEGYITSVDAEGYGMSALLLGAGRNKKDDKIDSTAGIILRKKTGDYVKKGDVIAVLYANDQNLFDSSEERLLASTVISEKRREKRPLIFETLVKMDFEG